MTIEANVTLIGSAIFRVSGTSRKGLAGNLEQFSQVAVVYAADGGKFFDDIDTIGIERVEDLVGLNLIEPENILLNVKDTIGSTFVYDVNATGRPDSTLFLFLGSHQADIIPTLSEWAMIVFCLLLLGMVTWYVVKRRRVYSIAA